MPFKTLAKLGKLRRRDVLPNVPGTQTRKQVKDIVLDVIKERRTVRKFESKPISDDILNKILEAARYAPSAGNQQPWEFIIIQDHRTKHKVSEICFGQKFLEEAPVLVVVGVNTHISMAKYEERGEKLYGVQATAAAIENMLIAAESLGIGSAWVGAFSEKSLAILTHCPDYIRPCAVLAFGYPAVVPPIPHRQELKEFVHFETFGNTYIFKEIYKEEEIF